MVPFIVALVSKLAYFLNDFLRTLFHVRARVGNWAYTIVLWRQKKLPSVAI